MKTFIEQIRDELCDIIDSTTAETQQEVDILDRLALLTQEIAIELEEYHGEE